MDNKEAKTPVPFGVMKGDSELFIANDKKYKVKPMKIGDALNFANDTIAINSQIFNLALDDRKKKIDEYLSKYCAKESGETMSLDSAIADDWDVVDLKNFVKKMCDISG
jgi:hypothetical protein